ncbi:marvel domain-containing protein [Microdochium trichocladiopsis]|uniref:Marvel domain-containing protein n=1 Tax=Microdochium trichocladiopsis TaxID=1682393 RepID=A0A9P9BMA8_9PEZI|nr:marvel domain-containing protein [Microdochium trichocladiopsis]KAH7026095.1 marvel domain-containing protein [Microdochium trichocladiopsis]
MRLAQVLLVLLATALLGNALAISSPDTVINFLMFVCALNWIAILWGLVTHFISSLDMPIISMALDGLAALFTFIGAVVISAKLTAVNCSNLSGFPSDYVAFGSGDNEKKCRELQAGTVFLWFLLPLLCATLFLAFREFRRGGSVVSRPSMSQIGV